MYRVLLPFFLLVTVLSACTKQENVNNAPADMVVGGYMSTRLNGVNWIADTGYATAPYTDLVQLHGEHYTASNKLTDIILTIDAYHGPDTYILTDTGAATGMYYYNVLPYNAETGIVTIDEDDSLHLRGSFRFTGTTGTGVKIDVTNGQFNLKKR